MVVGCLRNEQKYESSLSEDSIVSQTLYEALTCKLVIELL